MPAAMPIALVVQRRVRDGGTTAFALWEERVASRLRTWPGFVSQESVPPSPPVNVDWTIVQHFTDAQSARGWLQSPDRAALVEEVRDLLVGQEEVHLLPERGARPARMASALITYEVPEGEEAEFLKWQRRIQVAQTRSQGFVRHKIERPVPGVHDDWLIVLSFDTEEHLQAWLDSPERKALIDEGGHFGKQFKVRYSNHGFDFWFPSGVATAPTRHGIFKSNLLVLLVLYPLVFLWMYFVSAPFIEARGTPFWAALFIGNFVTSQLLGWWMAPMIFKAFAWWTEPDASPARQATGYAAIAALYGLSMALYAWLLAHPL
ncbi:MAG: antibiotic biosynthesis monooxygenase [Proteobacteria bacterium]|nr:antibiotic biosynthesis monooxygenase [Pseudomonadota bacterium]